MGTKPLQINSATPVSTALEVLLKRSLHIRFKKKALFFEVSSAVDSASGATKSSEACGQLFGFDTSKESHHGFIRIRDKRTRQLSDTAVIQEIGGAPAYDAFDWRTIIFFRFPMELNIPEIEGYVPGLGWVAVDLRNRRFWAAAPQNEEGINEFNNLMRSIARVRAERNAVKKARDNGKKRPFMSDAIGSHNDRRYRYSQTSGNTDKLFVVSTGEEVKKVRRDQPDKKISLVADFGSFELPDIPRAESAEDVANLAARFDILGEVESELSKSIRKIELGLIEDVMIGESVGDMDSIRNKEIQYGDVTYTVKLGNDASYDYPDGTPERWAAGELEMKNVPTNAQWTAKEITEVVEVEPETVNA